MIRFARTISVLFTLVLSILSCRKASDANWDIDAVFPVVNSKLNVRNFISDTLFEVDANNLLHVRIKQQLAALQLDSLLSLPDTTIPIPFKSPWETILQPGNVISVPVSDIKFDFPEEAVINTLIVRSGKLKVEFSNDLTQPLDMRYRMATVQKNGQNFEIFEVIPPGQKSLVKEYDLSGYTVSLKGSTGTQFNTLAQTATVNLSSTATGTALIKFNSGANVDVSFIKIIPEFIEGYFGQQAVELQQDTAAFEFLSAIKASNFQLSDANMTFSVVNEFGVDFSGGFNEVSAYNSKTGAKVTLSGTQLQNININRATRVGNTLTEKTKVFTYNAGNSNITNFISTLPDRIIYSGHVKMNPVEPGDISGYHDFAFYNTGIKVKADIDVPLKFSANYFELQTLSDFEFSGNSALDGVNDGAFVVTTSNGFPFSANVQAYLYDANNTLLDSVFVAGQNVVKAGVVNSLTNEVTTPVTSQMRIPVTRATLDNLVRTKKIKVVSRLILPNSPPPIPILSTYEIDMKIICEVNYNVAISR